VLYQVLDHVDIDTSTSAANYVTGYGKHEFAYIPIAAVHNHKPLYTSASYINTFIFASCWTLLRDVVVKSWISK